MSLGAACSGSSSDESGSGASVDDAPRRLAARRRHARRARRPGRPPVTTPATRPAGTVVLVPASIDATGKADVTQALQKFIDKVPNGRVIEFRHNGRYRIDGTLFVMNRQDLTFERRRRARCSRRRAAGRDRAQWWIKDGSKIVVPQHHRAGRESRTAAVAKGAYVAKLETQHGFRFEGVNGAELDHVRVTDVYGDFVYIGRDKHQVPSRNVWIHDSTFRRNGRQGIAVTAATNVDHRAQPLQRHAPLDDRPRAERAQLARVERVRAGQHRGQGPLAVRRVARSGPGQQRRDLGQPPARPPAHDRRARRRARRAARTGSSPTMSAIHDVHSRPMRFCGSTASS